MDEIIEISEENQQTEDVYKTMFADYPDIVGAEQICEMLGLGYTAIPL